MGITHEKVVSPGERGKSEDWNADHVISDDLMPKSQATKIVAAYNSIDKTRADFVCNGINDDVEIQAAIDSLPDQGGSVYLKEGNYSISSSIVISKENVKLFGAGANSVIQWASNIPCITSTYSSLVIDGIRLNGPGSSNTSANGIDISLSGNCTINKCNISNCRYGIYIHGNSPGNYITNNFVGHCYYSIYFNEVVKSIINSNQLYVGTRGVFLTNGSSTNLISSNCINGFSESGAYLNGVWDCIISNNIIFNSIMGGIIADGGGNGNSLIGNIISEIMDYGIVIYYCEYFTISGNSIYGTNANSGILIEHGNYNIISSNISFFNNTYGIEIDANSDRVIVVGNMLRNNGLAGLLNNGTNTEVAHNITS
jgi:parallel beta-helix repeat protein